MLNAALKEPADIAHAAVPAPRGAPLRLTCLLMDDDRIDRQAIRRVARHSQYRIEFIETSGLAETREMLACTQPDVVLLDFRVPDGDGIELTREIVAQGGEAAPPIIVVTGEGDEGTAVRSIRSGAVDYLCKNSLTTAAFDSAIARALLRRRVGPGGDDDLPAGPDLAARTRSRIRMARSLLLPLAEHVRDAAAPSSGPEATRTATLARALSKLLDDTLIDAITAGRETRGETCDLRVTLTELVAGRACLRRFVTVLPTAHLPAIAAVPERLALLVEEILGEAIRGTPDEVRPEIVIGGTVDRHGGPLLVIDAPSYPADLRMRSLGDPNRQGLPATGSVLVFCQRLAMTMGAILRIAATPQGGARTMIRFPRQGVSGTQAEPAVDPESGGKVIARIGGPRRV